MGRMMSMWHAYVPMGSIGRGWIERWAEVRGFFHFAGGWGWWKVAWKNQTKKPDENEPNKNEQDKKPWRLSYQVRRYKYRWCPLGLVANNLAWVWVCLFAIKGSIWMLAKAKYTNFMVIANFFESLLLRKNIRYPFHLSSHDPFVQPSMYMIINHLNLPTFHFYFNLLTKLLTKNIR